MSSSSCFELLIVDERDDNRGTTGDDMRVLVKGQ